MSKKFQLKALATALLAASGQMVSLPSFAQTAALEEIFVTARRKDESIQDVPIMVNGVTDEQLAKLNIRNFEDLEGTVAGLTLSEDSIAPNASLRGVEFNTFTGGSPTVEFYLNDVPGSPLTVMQAMFDVSRVEVLRGPQGTLRGRASPSGSITVTTAQAETDMFTGFVDMTLTESGDKNFKGAANFPLIEDVLGMRISAIWEESGGNEVDNIAVGGNSEFNAKGYRISFNYQPSDSLAIRLMHQELQPERVLNKAVESANIADSSQPASPLMLRAEDRKAVSLLSEVSEQTLETTTLQVSWDINDMHQFNYSGGYLDEIIERIQPSDVTDAGTGFGLPGLKQDMYTRTDNYSHEIRFQSTEEILGGFDYVAGAFYQKQSPGTDLVNESALLLTLPGLELPFANASDIFSGGPTEESSVFANLTYFLDEDTEVSAGVRYIEYEIGRALVVGETINERSTVDWNETIYMATLKHNFSHDVMAYFSYGTSWRRGIDAVGDFSELKSDLQAEFTTLGPEESESFELGAKTTWLDQRLRVNVAAFFQEFENYPYRSGGANGVYYRSFTQVGTDPGTGAPILGPQVAQHNFVAAVPVDVYGLEADIDFVATENLSLSAVLSYAKGEFDDSPVPCNDYSPNDGRPDSTGSAPSLTDIVNAAGDDNLTACTLSLRANNAPLFTGTINAEYSFMVGEWESYVRGQITHYGKSKNEPANPYDDVDAYNIFNLYAGVSDPSGSWEFMVYAKNLLDEDEVIEREAAPGSLGYTVVDLATSSAVGSDSATSTYRQVALTDPREVGVNVRYYW